jgi:hypothetical protein
VLHTDENNWLTMYSQGVGSAAFTEFGLNMSAPVTDKLGVEGQLYDRNLGQLGQYHPSLDWGGRKLPVQELARRSGRQS